MPTVLVVDDEPDVLESTGMLVESLGHNAILLDDPAELLDTIEREHPDLVLQDLRMHGLNVSGFMASLRANDATADIPVVFFSAHEDLPATATRYDAWGYLSKPFSREALAEILRKAFEHPRESLTEVRENVRMLFHGQWNLLSALANYVRILERRKVDIPEDTLKGLTDILLQLESRTDRLRTYVMGVLDSLEAIQAQPPRRRRPMRPQHKASRTQTQER
jgi:DNA-binding NtrC family response regulator